MNPVVLLSLLCALGLTPGGLTVLVPGLLARLFARSGKRKSEAHNEPETHMLLGVHAVLAIGFVSIACSQLPLPWNLLSTQTIESQGYFQDVLLFLMSGAIAVAVTVRNRPPRSLILFGVAVVIVMMTLATVVGSISFVTVVNNPSPSENILLILVAVMFVCGLPTVMSAANGWSRPTVPYALGVASAEVALALLHSVLTGIGVVGWIAAAFLLLVTIVGVERWGRFRPSLCWIGAGIAGVISVAVLLIGFVD